MKLNNTSISNTALLIYARMWKLKVWELHNTHIIIIIIIINIIFNIIINFRAIHI